MIEFLHKNWLEIFAVITGLLYVYLQIRQNKIMWIVGFISSAMFVYIFFSSKIYAQSAIYGYYVIISVYGYWKWSVNAKFEVSPAGGGQGGGRLLTEENPTPLIPRQRGTPPRILYILIAISIILSAILGWVLTKTDSPIPYYDGLVAGFSVVATWMVTQKIIQHWYFWMGINLFCVPLYASQELYFTAFMFLVYFIMSIIGLREWEKNIESTSCDGTND